jgi:hypothetical protein
MSDPLTQHGAKPQPEGDGVTAEQAAATTFEPWTHVADEWIPPKDEEWTPLGEFLLPNLRMAWAIMYKPKAELERIARELDGDVFTTMVEGIAEARNYFKGATMILQAAELRVLSAAASMLAADGLL